jgi:hypothetical protein
MKIFLGRIVILSSLMWPVVSSAQEAQHVSNPTSIVHQQEANEFWPPVFGYRLKITDTLLVAFTCLLFFATLALWWSTRSLVKSADKNAGLQLRAYILVSECRMGAYEVDKLVSASVTVKNTGQTPSHNTMIITALKYRTKTDSEPLELNIPESFSNTSLGAGADKIVKISSATPLTRAQSMAIANGEARIVVHGIIRYNTVFGDRAETDFKFFYNERSIGRGDGILHVASDGNRAA